MQEGYAVGYLLAAVAAYFILEPYGWRMMFLLGGAAALFALFVRVFVKESEVWRNDQGRKLVAIGAGHCPALEAVGVSHDPDGDDELFVAWHAG